jgi:creatinine amidohydrolase/Fe(II)-dependent formamide hydrolase-like protein
VSDASDPLALLEVIDRLEVGPAVIAADRLTTPYRVEREGRTESFELIYRYEEPVFTPGDPAAANLAAMVGAQVAVNFGLFCREIVFAGPYDAADRRLLGDMLANTAREIYVKKFLQPNPYLRGPAASLPVVRRSRYSRAAVRFAGAAGGRGGEPAAGRAWATDADRWAVLSSGGKDSLLSYGLLAELGREVHPIFLNESGRHWFTALNAYRHFQAAVPRSARVWTNSDRLFSWMLRHLPFVRGDYQSLRADEYPVRLWTVAVFLFGALPLLARRGIGRLVIGDEHDTTVRATHQGIPHYDGLFDQSRFFDHALSRYFRRKGWGVTQGSLLRPLSELLIEKVLAERYPELLALQVSCHAAHTEGERVRPCGRCEKCRRVAGMLMALGQDPAVLGYPPEAVPGMLRNLAEKGTHQETAGVEQLGHLLHQRGLIAEPRLGTVAARPRPEILQLRFHAERSPVEEVPAAIRRPLYGILLPHAEGAVRRVRRRWVPFDLLADAEMARPYPFDVPIEGPRQAAEERSAGAPEKFLWGELTWPEAKQRLGQVDVALLPVGAVEQHGPHLPLDTDAFDAEYLARQVAAACSDPKPLVLPLVPYGVSYHHEDFPGTVSLTNETLARLVYEIGLGAARNGITKLVIVNGHGGNAATLHFAAQMINRDARIFTCVDSGETSDREIEARTDTPNDVHAGEVETSTSLAVRPELVQMEAAEAFVPSFSSDYLDFTSEVRVDWYARTARISPSGVLGDPTRASRDKGEELWRLMIDKLVELVEHLKSLSLDEIYERRY